MREKEGKREEERARERNRGQEREREGKRDSHNLKLIYDNYSLLLLQLFFWVNHTRFCYKGHPFHLVMEVFFGQ